MKRSYPLPFFCLAIWAFFMLSGCYVRQSYYVSPFNGNVPGYHVMPQVSDSARSAIYGGVSYFGGNANEDSKDHQHAVRLDIYRSHHGRLLQGYYGLDLTLGDYNTGTWDSNRLVPVNFQLVNARSGPHRFGGLGISGGLNLVTPLPAGEWRYIGIEGSMHREWGDYLRFRQHLPDSAASLIIRDAVYANLGLSTEMIRRLELGEFGFRLGMGWSLGADYQHSGIHDNAGGGPLVYRYYLFNFHYTYDRYTAFLQFEKATKAASIQIGVQFRMTKPRLSSGFRRN